MLGSISRFCFLLALCTLGLSARTVVFWQDGFPAVATQPVKQTTLQQSLEPDSDFESEATLSNTGVPNGTDLLVLPYGSAFPAAAWGKIHEYLKTGGGLLVIGGQPLRVPVTTAGGQYVLGFPQDRYARELGILHTYEAPDQGGNQFVWQHGFEFLPKLDLHPSHSFVLEGRRLNGLAYLLNGAGERVSAPVVVQDRPGGGRSVFLDFEPQTAAWWEGSDGVKLLRSAADQARAAAVQFGVDVLFSTIKPGETPLVSAYARGRSPLSGTITVEVVQNDAVLASKSVPCSGSVVESTFDLPGQFQPGLYFLRGTWKQDGRPPQSYENAFWVEDEKLLKSGPALAANQNTLTLDGEPFLVAGTNYFSTESNGWDFSGPRNAAVWERDFAEMEEHHVNFVRTGVWGGQFKLIDGATGGVTERFLRNVEAYLLCAHRHHIAVNFTFFAFDPQSTMRAGESNPVLSFPGGNPYLDPTTIHAEQSYMLSIVERFKNVPWLSWDLINEPSFSNPRALWHGNTPNNDPAEVSAWHAWLEQQYGSSEKLAAAWHVTPDQLPPLASVPLPSSADFRFDPEHGDAGMVRAYDYNLFAQHSFAHWTQAMVDAIRGTGSRQIIDVGQDEGGVETRVLNQFYAHSGLAFTTNHTYRQNQDLLWDSWAAKVPGVPNIVGETGYQPITYPNGDWHFDELTGASLNEAKWAAGFAAGTTGFVPWDWDREVYFGLLRSDGSLKVWDRTLSKMGAFAEKAAPYAKSMQQPEIAIVLPQSLQLSPLSQLSIEAQQKSFRALYGYARGTAYAVGEDQVDLLGKPKLILLPSPWVLNSRTWDALLSAVRDGATLLVSGRFDLDAHWSPTSRAQDIGIPYQPALLQTVETRFQSPAGEVTLRYGSKLPDLLQMAVLPDGKTFEEKQLGSGRILFAALPLELNDNLSAVGGVYRYAMKVSGVQAWYTTGLQDPDLLICPTRLANSTLYVLSSLTGDRDVRFTDARSGKELSTHLASGRSALVVVSDSGQVVASYNWQ